MKSSIHYFLFLTAVGAAIANLASPVNAQYVANSLAELRSLASTKNNATITLAAGEYWIDGDHIANPTQSEPIFLELGGSGNTYNLGAASIKLDTRKLDGFGRALAHDSTVEVVHITGNNNTVNGLNLSGEDVDLDTDPNAQRWADWSAVFVQVSGDSNTVDGANIVSRGSSPYGLSDAFGKGARQDPQGLPADEGGLPFIGHRKTSNFLVRDASNTTVNDIHLTVLSYGHGFFVQKASDTVLTNSTVTGELVSSSNIIDHPLYQEYGVTAYGTQVPEGIELSTGEDGVRTYGTIDGVPVTNFTADNVVVTNLRSGFATSLTQGEVNISNSEVYGNEKGFGLGSNATVTNSKGDITNGPLVQFFNNNARDSNVEVELVGDVPVGVNWSAAYLNGENLDVTINSDLDLGDLPEESLVRFGQTFFEDWRDDLLPTGPEDADPGDFIDSTFTNNTNQGTVLGRLATNNVGSSQSFVVSNGRENYYDGVTLVASGTRTTVEHRNGLGNDGQEVGAEFNSSGNVIYTGTATDATYDDNGTVVEAGATLEILPSIQVTNERVTITGNGVDGLGAIYSDGSNDNGTRLVGNTNEELIILDGDASIGVGDAEGQLLVSRISGTGNFTKLGAGTLSVERFSSFDGDFIVAEGRVVGRTGTVQTDLFVNTGASIGAIQDRLLNAPDSNATINGTLDLNSRTDDNNLLNRIGSISGSGAISISNLSAGAGGTLEILGDGGNANFQGTINGAVTLVKDGGSTQVLSGTLRHTGTTTINDGLLLVNGLHLDSGSNQAGDYFVNSGGVLGGTGTLFSKVTVSNGGTLAPGASAGLFRASEVELQNGATLEIELGGTQANSEFDVLGVLGDLVLDGELLISLIDAFNPSASDVFNIVTAVELEGVFDNVLSGERLDTIGGEGSFLVTYDSTSDSVVLSDFLSVSNGIEGDYNSDGFVDAADYVSFRDGGGNSFAAFANNFGASQAPAVIASGVVAVPEPNSLTLLAVCGAILSIAGRRS